MTTNKFDALAYWEKRLASNMNLQGTGHRAFCLEYNRWLYQAQFDCLEQVLQRGQVSVRGQDVLDIGSGSGYYVDYFLRQEACSVTGVDISPSSVQHLRGRFPQARFFQADISESELPLQGTFGIVSVISVLYHIVDNQRFEQAIHHLCRLMSNNGYLLITDTFARSFYVTPKHARFRLLEDYRSLFERYNVRVLQVLPMYYWLNRSFIPIVGPWLISTLRLGRLFYSIDSWLRLRSCNNGSGMKLILAQKREDRRVEDRD
jgi:SAM-dependent methyltransferase